MSTYTQIIYQIVFSTKNREHTLTSDKRPELFEYIWGILKNKHCRLYRINSRRSHTYCIKPMRFCGIAFFDKLAENNWL